MTCLEFIKGLSAEELADLLGTTARSIFTEDFLPEAKLEHMKRKLIDFLMTEEVAE